MAVKIHPNARVSDFCDIEASQRGTQIEICSGAMIDSFVKIKPAGGTGDIVVGEQSYINSGCVLYSGNGISIGRNVLIAANCTLAATNHQFLDSNKLISKQGFLPSKGGIVIESDVWIGANTVILDGAYIEEGCVIGAGSIVRKRLAAYHVYAGEPLCSLRRRIKSEN